MSDIQMDEREKQEKKVTHGKFFTRCWVAVYLQNRRDIWRFMVCALSEAKGRWKIMKSRKSKKCLVRNLVGTILLLMLCSLSLWEVTPAETGMFKLSNTISASPSSALLEDDFLNLTTLDEGEGGEESFEEFKSGASSEYLQNLRYRTYEDPVKGAVQELNLRVSFQVLSAYQSDGWIRVPLNFYPYFDYAEDSPFTYGTDGSDYAGSEKEPPFFIFNWKRTYEMTKSTESQTHYLKDYKIEGEGRDAVLILNIMNRADFPSTFLFNGERTFRLYFDFNEKYKKAVPTGETLWKGNFQVGVGEDVLYDGDEITVVSSVPSASIKPKTARVNPSVRYIPGDYSDGAFKLTFAHNYNWFYTRKLDPGYPNEVFVALPRGAMIKDEYKEDFLSYYHKKRKITINHSIIGKKQYDCYYRLVSQTEADWMKWVEEGDIWEAFDFMELEFDSPHPLDGSFLFYSGAKYKHINDVPKTAWNGIIYELEEESGEGSEKSEELDGIDEELEDEDIELEETGGLEEDGDSGETGGSGGTEGSGEDGDSGETEGSGGTGDSAKGPESPTPSFTNNEVPGGSDPEVPPLPTLPGNSIVFSDNGVYIELGNNGIPKGEWRYDENTGIWIFEEYPPLGTMPKTGDGWAQSSPSRFLVSGHLFLIMGGFLVILGLKLFQEEMANLEGHDKRIAELFQYWYGKAK